PVANKLYVAQYNPSRVSVVDLAGFTAAQIGSGILTSNGSLDLALDPLRAELYVTDGAYIRVLDIAPGGAYGLLKRSLAASGGVQYSGLEYDAALHCIYTID